MVASLRNHPYMTEVSKKCEDSLLWLEYRGDDRIKCVSTGFEKPKFRCEGIESAIIWPVKEKEATSPKQ